MTTDPLDNKTEGTYKVSLQKLIDWGIVDPSDNFLWIEWEKSPKGLICPDNHFTTCYSIDKKQKEIITQKIRAEIEDKELAKIYDEAF